MKETNLNIFYQLGAQLNYLDSHLRSNTRIGDLFLSLVFPRKWLEQFILETEEYKDVLKKTRFAAQNFLRAIYLLQQETWDREVVDADVHLLSSSKERFEEAFEIEHRNLDVFTVTPKGIYNTRLLIEAPEKAFPEELRRVLPRQTLYDLEQAGRCLAFDIPTGCAFHICRGTEALMLAYYFRLAQTTVWPFKKRDWNIYIEQLHVKGAPKKITDRLKEIQERDRNSYIHPEKNVEPYEAQVLFDLCKGVNSYMAEEMVKLTT